LLIQDRLMITELSELSGLSQLHLLGGFHLVVEGARVRVQPSGQRLLALLGLRGACPRVLAAGTLWGDVPERKALACLRTTIWRLRIIGLLVSEPASDMLRSPPGLPADVNDLPGVVAAWRAAAPTGSPPASQELLPGWYEDWVILERERVRQALIHRVEWHADRAIRDGDPHGGVEWGLLAVRIDPLRESAHRLVIRAHLAAGNTGEARRHFASVLLLMHTELGVPPSNQLRELAGVR
jgi:DNA-binding SARP family transcriptional activator